MTVKLLIVDDSDLIRAGLISLLQGIPGIDSIHTAHSLAQALESVRSILPSMLILDLHLPDGNALSVLSALKDLAPDMQIVMLTNDASTFNRSKCLATGANWFFDKSMEYDSLLDLVRNQATGH
jgi:DNA-binding NarL/FixJ family response regulator